jgi:hypothetical protein
MGHRALARKIFGGMLFCFGLASPACAGGQTGEGPPSGLGTDDDCDEVIVEIDLDDDAALGFAPRHVLELASGPHTEPLHWWPETDFPYGPEQGAGSVTFEVTSTDAPPRYVDSEPKNDEPSADCSDWIEVDAMLSIQSAGGALDESIPVTLVAGDPNVVSVATSLDYEMLGGSLAFEDTSVGGYTLEKLSLRGVFSQYGASGVLETYASGSGSASMGLLATWPTTELCDRGSTPTVLRDSGEASIEAGLELLAAATGLVFTTPNDEIVAVELGAMDDGGPACLARRNSAYEGSVITDVVLSISSEDGAVEHDLVGLIAVLAASDGSLAEVTIAAHCNAYPTVEFPGKCGDWGVDVTGYIGVNMEARISVRPPSDAPEVDGTFTLSGVPECAEGDTCDDDPVDIAVFSLARE